MGNTAKVVGMMPVDERVKEAAHRILDDVVAVQTSISGLGMVPVVVRSGLNAIQVQARSLLSGGQIAPLSDGPVSQDYRQDMLEMLDGLFKILAKNLMTPSDEHLQAIAMAAGTAHGRINNYLTVKQAENRLQRREDGNGLAQLTA